MVRHGLPQPTRAGFGIIAKALLALAKCLFGPLAVLDVGGRSIPFDNVAEVIAQRIGTEQEPAVFAIETPEPRLKLAWQARLPNSRPLHQHGLLVVGVKRAWPAGFDLIRREAGIVEGRLIEEVGTPLRSGAPPQRRDRIDHKSEAIFGFLDLVKSLLQRVLCKVLLGDIDVGTNQFGC